jgi:hypothetical protein
MRKDARAVAVLVAGFAAGAGDTLLAFLMYHVGPGPIYRSVASGLMGREAAVRGDLLTAALGMLLHFFIATTAAAVYFAAAAKLKLLLQQAVLCGLAFGVGVYFFMKDVVVPLSLARPISFTWAGLVGHALLVGLPIALVAQRSLGHTSHGENARGQ